MPFIHSSLNVGQMPAQAIKVKTNTKEMIKWLKRKHGHLEMASADTLNLASKKVEMTYRGELKTKYKLKNKFTLGSIQTLKATAKGSAGFRPISNINSIVGIRKMKGGKPHYMKKQEEGARISGSTKSDGKVPIPLKTARTSKSDRKPVARKLRLDRGIQTLQLGGRRFGHKDKFNPRQRWAIIHKYRKTGKWDLSKPFFFSSLKKGLGVFVKKGAKIGMIRTLSKSAITIKPRHSFSKAVHTLTPSKMEQIFGIAAKKHLAKR